jgi:hypothetical protein
LIFTAAGYFLRDPQCPESIAGPHADGMSPRDFLAARMATVSQPVQCQCGSQMIEEHYDDTTGELVRLRCLACYGLLDKIRGKWRVIGIGLVTLPISLFGWNSGGQALAPARTSRWTVLTPVLSVILKQRLMRRQYTQIP